MTRKKIFLFMLCGSAVLSGCYPQGPDTAEDFNIIVTKHDVAFAYKSLRTFALPDSVIKVNGNLEKGDSIEFINSVYSDAILSGIRQNMNEYGWMETDKNNNPDVFFLPGALERTTTTYNHYYYGSGYWYWWYPAGWSGWYYPYPAYSGTFTTGSILLLMAYPDTVAVDSVTIVWSSLINGLLEGESAAVRTQIDMGLNHAFKQSPYLDLTTTK